jgi:hypothetical protein
MNIRNEHMFQGIPLIPSRDAAYEMLALGLTIEDCKHILEQGEDAPRKRARGTIERWLRGKKTYNVVIVHSYTVTERRDIYLITHVGRFT